MKIISEEEWWYPKYTRLSHICDFAIFALAASLIALIMEACYVAARFFAMRQIKKKSAKKRHRKRRSSKGHHVSHRKRPTSQKDSKKTSGSITRSSKSKSSKSKDISSLDKSSKPRPKKKPRRINSNDYLGQDQKTPRDPTFSEKARVAKSKFHKLDAKHKLKVNEHVGNPNTIDERNLHKNKKDNVIRVPEEEKHVKIVVEGHSTPTTNKYESVSAKWPMNMDPNQPDPIASTPKSTDYEAGPSQHSVPPASSNSGSSKKESQDEIKTAVNASPRG
ncbi:unnamed protein product [Bursaphelenchus okinawaensis]|uniref:Uncharacterized protein n=1 Tax=Bursaphelenchus okinawaensis TaxID=465554 RepID=A0A811KBR8_9BILA|nr:unnamed protein product [Bursaphelenchus okinawaensis]CAG9097535.1 unnamed protein product [Bursaphelenchus okinawaensis]